MSCKVFYNCQTACNSSAKPFASFLIQEALVSNRQENGLQQTGEWSPRFWLQATFLSTSYFHTWAIIPQRLYHQEQLITVGKKNISDILTDSYIRDHRKNGLQDNLKRTDYEWSVLPI
ncbi:hypothetical protein QL285_061638 [Trifolium repens]|nr:hypothetical protein QL285_061634 [Trifolium repens]KAK2387911.1 hypothetical protein QL285_061638 [Trifolium repens]